MNKTELQIGDIVQLNPEKTGNKMFSGCFMVVTEPKEWGAQGYIQDMGQEGCEGGQAYYRANFEDMELCGKAVWIAV